MVDTRLSLSVESPNGTIKRWGPDEPNAEDIPSDTQLGTSLPGGYRDLSCSLLRRIDLEYTDQGLFNNVRAYGAGNRTAWDGRAVQYPRSHGESFGVSPGAVGWAAHLRDDPGFREIYVDRDVGRWMEATLARRRALAAAGSPQGKIPVSIGTGGITWLPPNEALPSGETTEVMYDAGPGLVAVSTTYRGQRTGAFTSFEAANIYTDDNEALASASATALTLDNTIRTANHSNERYLMLRCRTSAGVTPAVGHEQSFDLLAVYGNSGLTGTAISGSADGFLASTVIPNILTRAAPLLTYTTGIDGSIQTTDFAIPHLVFPDPVTAEDAIGFINAYHLWEWGVYDNREFFYREQDPDRLCWEARLSTGAHLQLEGDIADQIFNGVLVFFTDHTGVRRIAGPPAANWHNSTALADYTNAALVDTSLENPVNAHGIPRRWGKLEISQTTTELGAVQLGAVWLAEHSRPQRRGSITLTGTATHPTEGNVPVWRVRAGDYIRVADHSADVPRRIISTSYAHGSRTLTADLDNTNHTLSAIVERALGVQMVGVL